MQKLAIGALASILSTGVLCAADVTITVWPGNLQGWVFLNENTGAPGAGQLVDGPAAPPAGKGSANLPLTAEVTPPDRQLLSTLAFAGTRLDKITDLGFSSYRSSFDPINVLSIALQFDMDYDLTDANTAWQGRLVFEPYHTVGNTILEDTWYGWSPLAGKWWASGAPGNGTCPQSNPCTWTQVLTAFPNAGLRVAVGLVHFKAGAPWPGFDGNIDAFKIGVAGGDTITYDFEAGPASKDDCKNGGWQGFYKNQGQCVAAFGGQ